jgi:uncharacterized membrane protein
MPGLFSKAHETELRGAEQYGRLVILFCGLHFFFFFSLLVVAVVSGVKVTVWTVLLGHMATMLSTVRCIRPCAVPVPLPAPSYKKRREAGGSQSEAYSAC